MSSGARSPLSCGTDGVAAKAAETESWLDQGMLVVGEGPVDQAVSWHFEHRRRLAFAASKLVAFVARRLYRLTPRIRRGARRREVLAHDATDGSFAPTRPREAWHVGVARRSRSVASHTAEKGANLERKPRPRQVGPSVKRVDPRGGSSA
jgi:hypothetical protein